jgi:hypothetical protein
MPSTTPDLRTVAEGFAPVLPAAAAALGPALAGQYWLVFRWDEGRIRAQTAAAHFCRHAARWARWFQSFQVAAQAAQAWNGRENPAARLSMPRPRRPRALPAQPGVRVHPAAQLYGRAVHKAPSRRWVIMGPLLRIPQFGLRPAVSRSAEWWNAAVRWRQPKRPRTKGRAVGSPQGGEAAVTGTASAGAA